jgi:hypothetical protein
VIPLPRAWLLASAMLVGTAVGVLAGTAAMMWIQARVRPDVVIALVVGVPSGVGLLAIVFARHRWVTALGAFILALAPGWFACLLRCGWCPVADDESQPKTEPYTPTFDTGAFSQPLKSPEAASVTGSQARGDDGRLPAAGTDSRAGGVDAVRTHASAGAAGRRARAVLLPEVVEVRPGDRRSMGVAAPIGLGLFYWWYHSIDKTPAVFVVLVYVVVCTVGSLMLAMVQDRPLLSALAIAVMSALLASVAAAAPLYGYYYCQRAPHCVVGIIPY